VLFPGSHGTLKARTAEEARKAQALRTQSTLSSLLRSWKFMSVVTSVVVGWFVWYYLYTSMTGDLAIARFDPYAILGIDMGADDKQIKKSYRSLSLMYHPDKNPGNKMAEDMFVKITRAYEALTDQEARENWEKYGNPDGKQPMEVSIALPTFLLDKDWHNTILIVYLIIMVILIPALVAMWYTDSKKYGEKNVMYASYTWYNHMLNEKSVPPNMPEVLAGSAELRGLNPPGQDEKTELLDLYRDFVKGGVMPKPRYDHKVIAKGTVLLYAHLVHRKLSDKLSVHQRALLMRSPDLVEAMIELACSRRWLGTTLRVIQFSQYLVQGRWVEENTLMQLPHMTEGMAKSAMGKKDLLGNSPKKALSKYIALSEKEKSALVSTLSSKEKEEVLRAAKVIPDVEIKVSCFVDDEDQIAEGDLVTIKVEIIRRNVPEGQKCDPVYAPRFPAAREEAWWVLLGNERSDQLYNSERVVSQDRVAVKELRMMAPNKPCKVELDVYVLSDSYIGLDQKLTTQFEVISSDTLPVYQPHPDDLELDNEPTLFEQVMQGYDDSDSDEEDDAMADGASATKADGGGQAAPESDDDDDSDEDD
jgi:translocation protein SEC63